MSEVPPSRQQRAVAGRGVPALLLLFAGALLAVSTLNVLPSGQGSLLFPVLATAAVFAAFSHRLAQKVGSDLFGDLGFVYVGLAMAYTALPGLAFMLLDLDPTSNWGKLARLLPSPAELGAHLWRHALFITGVAGGYLWFRGEARPLRRTEKRHVGSAGAPFLMAMVATCAVGVWILSAPVVTYYDHYTRFEHLSWLPLRLAYVLLTLKSGGYFVLMVHLFDDFSRRRWLALLTVCAICTYELTYSLGSRIETLVILLGAACLYHHRVGPVRLRHGLLALLAIASLFTAVELYRASGFDISSARDSVAAEGAMPASEFGAVFFTGFHLYSERARGSLPDSEWPMLLSEFVQLIPFIDHTRWHPQYWYARNYFPDAVVPPETIGPIAESAIWGGEADLLFRGVLNGAFFAFIVRWFLRRESRWWAMVVYSYAYATSVLTLKYSVFYVLVPLVRVVVPSLLFVATVNWLFGSRERTSLLLPDAQVR